MGILFSSISMSERRVRVGRQVMAYVVTCVCAVTAHAQTTAPPLTPEGQIAAAEAAGALFPRALSSADSPPRKCTIVRPDQIVFPSTRGEPSSVNLVSGDFFAASISFGWGQTYEQAKMPLTPRHPDAIGNGLKMQVVRIDQSGEVRQLHVPDLVGGGGSKFFPTWPQFASPGRWMIVVTAGVNWGCFVLDRPVR
jgi:hypothetical protein